MLAQSGLVCACLRVLRAAGGAWRTDRALWRCSPVRGKRCLSVTASSLLRRCDAGIVQGKARVSAFDKKDGFATLRAAFPPGSVAGISVGASVAVNGTCLTVTQQQGDELCFDLIVETLRATNLGALSVDSAVNFERSARIGDEVGGHNVSGHIHATAIISAVENTPSNRKVVFKVPQALMKYILAKARETTRCRLAG